MHSHKTLRRWTLIVCAVLLAWSASVATAGEITGNGKWIVVNGKSECAYSGRQDDPEEDEGVFRNILVQSWGQLPIEVRAFLRSVGFGPGVACNPAPSVSDNP